ncbi:MAG: hypothetical protein FJ395_20910, partial [Verrucomicrobia bacterium]|nr:hypothetical protein [Verrucomicrobiota bacterium]
MKPWHFAPTLLLWLAISAFAVAGAETSFVALMRQHYDRVMAVGTDNYGSNTSGLWLASVDIHK